MVLMEISYLATKSIRIKGKQGTFIVNPSGKSVPANCVFIVGTEVIDKTKIESETTIIKGPGEYEIAGVKISGVRVADQPSYRLTIDKLTVLVGSLSSLEKDHAKVLDSNIVILYADVILDASFITALEPKVVLFFGEKGEEVAKQFAKEKFRKEPKYQMTIDKLPVELESVLLAA